MTLLNNPNKSTTSPPHRNDKKPRCIENNASILSRALFSWITPLISHGWHNAIELGSLPEIGIGNEMEAAIISAKFDTEWSDEKRRASTANSNYKSRMLQFVFACKHLASSAKILFKWRSKSRPSHRSRQNTALASSSPSLCVPLYLLISGYLLRALLARLVAELIPVFIPILVKITTTYAQQRRAAINHQLKGSVEADPAGLKDAGSNGPPPWQGYLLAASMLLMLLLYSWSFQWFFFEIGKATTITRTALMTAVYRKSLVLSAQAKARITMGRLTNLVSSDVSQIERGLANIIVCFTIPLQAMVSVAVLVYMLGPITIGGWAIIVALVPVQMWASRYLTVLREKAIRYTDRRIVAVRETLQGIKVVKLFVWEGSILRTIRSVRVRELALIARLNLARYGLVAFALHSPVFASIITFSIFVLTGGKLRTGPVFAVIGIFNSMSVPLTWLPGALAETRNSTIPLMRIQEMLLEEELDSNIIPQPCHDSALSIKNGCFMWNCPSDPGQVRDGRTDAKTSTSQIKRTLQAYRFPHEPKLPDPCKPGASFDPFCISNVVVPRGSLAMVIGPVGSGKSSFLSALVGEMKLVSGSIALGGTLSYASQVPWVTSATIRDNITFGLPFDRQKYIDAVEACALEADLQAMPDRDLTEVGERGVTLSGGQKQRISIARAVYAEKDIVLLDDCLSAVDVKLSRDIFKRCIKGLLANKTRIMTTNNLDMLSVADIVITMKNGRVVECGPFSQLMSIDGITAAMYNSFASGTLKVAQQQQEDSYTEESSIRTATPIRNTSVDSSSAGIFVCEQSNTQTRPSTAPLPIDTESNQDSSSEDASDGGETEECGSWIYPQNMGKKAMEERATNRLMCHEERVTGQVAIATHVRYIMASGGCHFFIGVVLCLIVMQGCRVGSDFWVRSWIRHGKEKDATSFYIGIYALFGAMQFVWFGLFAILLVASVYKASKKLHSQAIQRVMYAPMSFFDTTPLGRILNRFTRDIDSLDLALCDLFRQFYQNISRSVGSFVSISILVPIFLAPLIPLFAASWVLIYIYMRTSIEVQRVAATARSPLYSHFTQTLQGLTTIRAYTAQDRYISIADKMLDDANRPQWLALVAQNWIWLRIDFMSHLLAFVVCIVVITQPQKWDSAAVGLLLVQATQMGTYVTYAGRGWTELQNSMNSVERIDHYASALEQEAGPQDQTKDLIKEKGNPSLLSAPQSWPRRGTVIIRELTMYYRQGLPPALRSISMDIYDGDRVAIVGRSGAGKSSIISALFRLNEPSSGKIFVDGVDTQTLTLEKLRKSIGILPQDPVLFDGTLRNNLDPLEEFSDSEIWGALDLVCLHSQVSQHLEKLDMPVGEGGDSFSVGQRQLVCLARALLRKPRILVLDEATANVDHETDATIQRIILSKENQMTVISIAHRLQTIISYDKVFVIDDGQVIESGSPLDLLEQHLQAKSLSNDVESLGSVSSKQWPSAFHAMIKEMGYDAVERMVAEIHTSRASELNKK